MLILVSKNSYLPLKLPKIHNYIRLKLHSNLITLLIIEASLQTILEITENNIPPTSGAKKIWKKKKKTLKWELLIYLNFGNLCIQRWLEELTSLHQNF